MLFLLPILLLGEVAFGLEPTEYIRNRVFEGLINDTMECVRIVLSRGVPERDIPSFNPLQISYREFEWFKAGIDEIEGVLILEDFTFSGLMDFKVTALTGTIGLIPPSYTVSMTMEFPNTILNTRYLVDMVSEGKSIYGAGHMLFDARNFVADIGLRANILGDLELEYFTFWVSLEGVDEFEITGFLFDDEYSAYLTETIKERASEIAAENAPRINEIVGQMIVNLVAAGGEEGLLVFLLSECLGGLTKH